MESDPSLPSAAPRPQAVIYAQSVGGWRMPWWLRALMVAAGLSLILTLGVARCLTPSSRGYGTHQQLGLPQCRFQAEVGWRCPACGMTTSWAYLTRGNVWGALTVNTGGTLLGLLAMLTGPWLLASGAFGRWVGHRPNEYVVLAVMLVVSLVIVVDWIWRLTFA